MITTESRNPNTMHIDKASTMEMLTMIQNENQYVVQAVGDALPAIARAVDSITEGMKNKGRLIYIGAGTSGRLGVIDAAECPPTFGVDPDLISGIIAGGYRCLVSASEGAEDDGEDGIRAMKEKNLTPNDRVVGISAAGNAAFVADALAYARSVGCVTIGLTSNDASRLSEESDIPIVVYTGAEVVTGSTRMKAGTAQKLILNMLSTCAMIKLGNVYENLMINIKPCNVKIKKRVISIVQELCKCKENEAIKRLEANEWSIRKVMDAEEGLQQ